MLTSARRRRDFGSYNYSIITVGFITSLPLMERHWIVILYPHHSPGSRRFARVIVYIYCSSPHWFFRFTAKTLYLHVNKKITACWTTRQWFVFKVYLAINQRSLIESRDRLATSFEAVFSSRPVGQTWQIRACDGSIVTVECKQRESARPSC